MYSQKQLIDTFYSNFNAGIDYEGIQEIYNLLQNQYVQVEKITICSIQKLHQVIDKVVEGKIKIFDYEGGSKRHVALKVVAGDYILENFHLKVKYEIIYCGRRPDVISDDKTIIVECGDTDPRKILEYFTNDENIQIFVLPYNFVDQEELVAYLFKKRKADLGDHLKKKYIYSLSIVRQIIQSRGKPKESL